MTLSADQERFLALHARHAVVKWVWHFGETMLRAYTERGHTATIEAKSFQQLVARGFVRRVGCAGVKLTDKGKAIAA